MPLIIIINDHLSAHYPLHISSYYIRMNTLLYIWIHFKAQNLTNHCHLYNVWVFRQTFWTHITAVLLCSLSWGVLMLCFVPTLWLMYSNERSHHVNEASRIEWCWREGESRVDEQHLQPPLSTLWLHCGLFYMSLHHALPRTHPLPFHSSSP